MLRTEVVAARLSAGKGLEGLDAIAMAYVRFAINHPSYYRVMFGGFVDSRAKDPQFVVEATATFDVLVRTLVELQEDGLVRTDEPRQLARFVWATFHGVAMLGIDGQLKHQHVDARELIQYVVDRLRPALVPGN